MSPCDGGRSKLSCPLIAPALNDRSLLESRKSLLTFRTRPSSTKLKSVSEDLSPFQTVALISDVFIPNLSTTFKVTTPGRYIVMGRLCLDSMTCGISTTFKVSVRDQSGRSIESHPPMFNSWPALKWIEIEKQHGTRTWFEAEIITFDTNGSAQPESAADLDAYDSKSTLSVDFSLCNLDFCAHSSLKIDYFWLKRVP